MDDPRAAFDDKTLIDCCAKKDRAAFRVLYARWSGRLHGVALRVTRDPALAADAVHDAFVQVWQQAGRFDPSLGEAGAWLMSLARYRALDMVRRRSRDALAHNAPLSVSQTNLTAPAAIAPPMPPSPPKFCELLLACLAQPGRVEEVLGDAETDFQTALRRMGPKRAGVLYRVQLVRSMLHLIPAGLRRAFIRYVFHKVGGWFTST